MSITARVLARKTVVLTLAAFLALGGVLSFGGLGQLEDPDFTISMAIVTTAYPGASAEEVEQEVTDRLETAIQTLGQLDDVTSISRAGLSLIIVELRDTVPQSAIPQAWDELRRKISDTQRSLPPGVYPSLVNDDWGDVYGVLFAITGEGFSLAQLEAYAKSLRRSLLLVDDVGSVDLWGVRQEAINLEVSRARLSTLGMGPQAILGTVQGQGAVSSGGQVQLGDQAVRVTTSGTLNSLDDIRNLMVQAPGDPSNLRISDVATVSRGYLDPPLALLYYNGKPAIGLGLSTVPGGNVVRMGEAVNARLAELEHERPLGMELQVISHQSETVTQAVEGFLVNLGESLLIVIGLLMVFMGLRSGLLIGGVLLLDILGTFIYMAAYDISLQRISLGALIIALGMLVDNAIVVTEGILIRMQKGEAPRKAAAAAVSDTVWPLLGATLVAILAFAAISASQDTAGEYLSSLFQVIAVSLLLSWVLAITVTPVLGVMMLKVKTGEGETTDPYDTRFFRGYRWVLHGLIRYKWVTLTAVTCMLVAAGYGFGFVKQSFFPNSTRPQFYVNYWRAEGSHISATGRDLQAISRWLQGQEGVTSVTSFVGQGGPRFMLTYEPELPNTAYGQLLITVDNHERIDALRADAHQWIRNQMPDGTAHIGRFVFGPGGGAKIEARFHGEDPAVLRQLAEQAAEIMRSDQGTKDVRHDWRERVPEHQMRFSEPQARRVGISRTDLGRSVEIATSGAMAGLYRDGDRLLPVVLKLPEPEEVQVSALGGTPVWSSVTGRAVPADQVLSGFETQFVDPIIRRRNRQRTLTVKCDPVSEVAATLFARLRPRIEAIKLPPGYGMEWGGEYESAGEANKMLLANVPLFLALMFLLVVGLFNALRQPIIVFLTLPLALIGVSSGLLLTGQPFGFVALLGFLSLSGMLIKNAIVLLDQIELNLKEGMAPMEAVLSAGVSRVRPVTMAAFTTVLGMAPLVSDVFWAAMAVTIMAGLAFATVLTLLVVPVLYALFFRIKDEQPPGAPQPVEPELSSEGAAGVELSEDLVAASG